MVDLSASRRRSSIASTSRSRSARLARPRRHELSFERFRTSPPNVTAARQWSQEPARQRGCCCPWTRSSMMPSPSLQQNPFKPTYGWTAPSSTGSATQRHIGTSKYSPARQVTPPQTFPAVPPELPASAPPEPPEVPAVPPEAPPDPVVPPAPAVPVVVSTQAPVEQV